MRSTTARSWSFTWTGARMTRADAPCAAMRTSKSAIVSDPSTPTASTTASAGTAASSRGSWITTHPNGLGAVGLAQYEIEQRRPHVLQHAADACAAASSHETEHPLTVEVPIARRIVLCDQILPERWGDKQERGQARQSVSHR